MTDDRVKRLTQLRQAYEDGVLDEDTYRAAVAALDVQATAGASGAVAQEESRTVTTDSRGSNVVVTGQGIFGETTATTTALDRYLNHIISHNWYLQLQSLRSGRRAVRSELIRAYISPRAVRQVVRIDGSPPAGETSSAPGETHRPRERPATAVETEGISMNEALNAHRHLVVLGDPGSGKTTLLRYLALLYARDLAEGSALVREKLSLDERWHLPILLSLRELGDHLSRHADEARHTDEARHADGGGNESHDLLLDVVFSSLKSKYLALPPDFFDRPLTEGQAVILLDGLNEVADPGVRQRVSQLVEAFTRAYPGCRYVVTSRMAGYTSPVGLEEYATITLCDFTMADVERFLSNWHWLVAVGQMGMSASASANAVRQTEQLLDAIRANERVRELAITPLLLAIMSKVHREGVKLPDCRAKLYAEVVDVLLGQWEAKNEEPGVESQPLDAGDKQLMLQSVALRMHQEQRTEITATDLRRCLTDMFFEMMGNRQQAEGAANRLLQAIEAHTGPLVVQGEGVYAFSHLTLQEYLAALAVAGRDDYVAYTLERISNSWWQEVALQEAGHLSMQSKERTTHLIQAIADQKKEPELYHNLALAARCLRNMRSRWVHGSLRNVILQRLRAGFALNIREEAKRRQRRPKVTGLLKRLWDTGTVKEQAIWNVIERRRMATQALVRGGGGYWRPPYGEPEWVEITAGEFWMGEDTEAHQLYLDTFYISLVPITNAQYQLFVQATGHQPPGHWEEGRPLRGRESHPVVRVSWHDALAYCQWLSQVTGKPITLPSEAEWEKAARGVRDRRAYPWGDNFDIIHCNSVGLRLGDTTPVGIFPTGASPYGVLDMAGNVGEWTRSLWGKDFDEPEFKYPYDATDGRENLEAGKGVYHVLRGGSFHDGGKVVRCTSRLRYLSDLGVRDQGFRVIVASGAAP
jgi:formylglycine-generating enzyme required for sulfatase activity